MVLVREPRKVRFPSSHERELRSSAKCEKES
jgi:hypothetical protein